MDLCRGLTHRGTQFEPSQTGVDLIEGAFQCLGGCVIGAIEADLPMGGSGLDGEYGAGVEIVDRQTGHCGRNACSRIDGNRCTHHRGVGIVIEQHQTGSASRQDVAVFVCKLGVAVDVIDRQRQQFFGVVDCVVGQTDGDCFDRFIGAKCDFPGRNFSVGRDEAISRQGVRTLDFVAQHHRTIQTA